MLLYVWKQKQNKFSMDVCMWMSIYTNGSVRSPPNRIWWSPLERKLKLRC